MSFPEWKNKNSNSFVFPNTIIHGQVDISGTLYNRAGNVIIGDPNDNYSSNFPTIKCNEVQTQTLVNEQVSGSVNGFLIDNDPSSNILFLSSNGSFSDGLSIIKGQGVTDLTLSTINTNTNIMTLSTSATRPDPLFTRNMYITSGNKILFYDKDSISVNQGVQFTLSSTNTTINDFVSELSFNEVFLVNTTNLVTGGTQRTGYITNTGSSYYLITKDPLDPLDTLGDDNFLDGYGIGDISNNPLKVSPITGENNRYLISSYSNVYSITDEPVKQTHSGFNYNNKFFLLDANYVLADGDFVEPSDDYDLSGTTITLSQTDYYEYSAGTTVTDSVTFLTNKEGIYVSPNFYLFDGFNLVGENNETISNGDGVFITDISYGFLHDVNNNIYSTFSKTNLQDNTSSQIIGYISSDSKLVTNASDISEKFIVNSSDEPVKGISKIDSVTENLRVFNLNHNNVGNIKETSPSLTKTGYLFDENTLVLTDIDDLESTESTGFFFEIEEISAVGLHSSTNNYHNTITNSSGSSISTAKDIGTFEGAVINDNETYIYAHGKSQDASLNDIIYNLSFVDASSVGIIVSDPTTDRSNTYIIDYKGSEPSESTNTTVGAFFINRKIYLSSDVSDNDIIGTATNGYDMVGSCLTQQTYYVDLDYYPSSLQTDVRTGGNYYVDASNIIHVEKVGNFGNGGGSYTNYIAVYDSGNIFDRIITDTTTDINGTTYHVFTMATTISESLSGSDLKIFEIPSTTSDNGIKYGNVGWSTNPGSNVLIIEDTRELNSNTDLDGAVIFTKDEEFLGFVEGQTYDGNRTLTLTMSRTFTSDLGSSRNEVHVHLNKDTEINIHSPVSFDVYTPININIYQNNINLYDSQNYNFYKTVENKSYEPRSFNEYDKISCDIYENFEYNATTKTNINFPPLASEDTFVMTDFAQTLTQKTFSDDTTFQQDIDVVDVRATGDIIVENNLSCSNILDCSNNAVEHKIGDISIGYVTTYNVNNPALTHKDFVGTFNGFGMMLQNTGKTIINAIQGQDVSLRNNNTEYFYLDEQRTRLRVQSGSIIDAFCDATNLYMDFQPNGVSDYAVRLQCVKVNNTKGNSFFDTYCYRTRMFAYNGVKQLEMGYLNTNESLIMGRSAATYIRFNSNTEIYYHVNNTQRFIMSSSGVMWATGGFVQGSDRRLKKNIVDVSNALQTINTLQVKEFDKKCSFDCDDCTEETIHQIGFIAQEVQETDLSYCVSDSLLNDTLGINGETIYSLNVKATQELYELVMKQQEEIINLSQRLNQTLDRLSKLENI